MKVGIAHEGRDEVNSTRYKLREKTVCSGMMDGERRWEGFYPYPGQGI